MIDRLSIEGKLKLCLVRHGETEENLSRILQGHLPGLLTNNGRQQVMLLRDKLPLKRFDVIVSSDLKRATDTVELLMGNQIAIPWEKTSLLREIDWGSVTGCKIEDVDFKHLPKDVETKEALFERAKRASQYLIETHAGKSVLLVSHGLFLRSLIANLTNVAICQLHTVRRMENCESRWLVL